MLVNEKQVKIIEDVEDRLAYTQQVQDQCHKLRTQLSLGFDGNGETNILLMMLIKPIREPILPEIERIKKEYAKILNEEAGKIIMKYGTRKIQYGEENISISQMFKELAEEKRLENMGIYKKEKLIPDMFEWNNTARAQFDISKLKSDNIVNGNILQLVLDRLYECNLLLDFEDKTNI